MDGIPPRVVGVFLIGTVIREIAQEQMNGVGALIFGPIYVLLEVLLGE